MNWFRQRKDDNMNYLFGVDLGGTTVKLGLFTEEGVLVEQWEIPTRKEQKGSLILPDIAQAIERKMQETGIGREQCLGVGIGVPGPVDGDGIVRRCVNLGWEEFNVEEAFTKLTGMPCRVGNDANVAALGEVWEGGAKGCSSVVMVTLGTGVGGGIVIDGHMVAGTHGAGGEIGHITVSRDEPEACNCGKKGCLEQYASATGIVKQMQRILARTEEDCPLRSMERFSAKKIFDYAKEGDRLCLQAVEQLGENLGYALAGISCVCDPEMILLGGGVSRAGDILLKTVEKYYKQYAFHATADCRFAIATLGNQAGIYGAAKLALSK